MVPIACAPGGSGGGCGDSGDYVYPRDQLAAAPTVHAARGRLTQQGFDTMAASLPGIVADMCAANPADGSESCAVNPANQDQVLMYLSDGGQPLEIDAGIEGRMLPGSVVGLDTPSLDGNIHIELVQDGQGGAVRVTLGCQAPNITNCSTDTFVNASMDVLMEIDEARVPIINTLIYRDSLCFLQDDDPPAPGLVIQSMRFLMKPRVELGDDSRPYLVIAEEDVTVERMELALDIAVGKKYPECSSMSGDCDACPWLQAATSTLEVLLETGPLAQMLAYQLAQTALESLSDQALEASGALDLGTLVPIANAHANPTGYLIGANPDSPTVTGSTGALGMNLDLDAGFVADPSLCVPRVAPTSFALPPIPDPSEWITPPGGVLERPDAALLVGDAMLNRAFYELFDGGSLCLALDADNLADLSGGAFVPTVGALGIVAPGLASLAPANAPVDLGMSPQWPPIIEWGTGIETAGVVDSHLKLHWPDVVIDLYPLVDDAHVRAIAFSVDIEVGISLEPGPTGSLSVHIDTVEMNDLGEVYNEMAAPFDAAGVGELVSVFVPQLLGAEGIEVPLSSETLGFPFVPKMRLIERLGQNRYLAMYMRFCAPDDIVDSSNTLCYEPPTPPALGHAPRAGDLAVHVLRGVDDGDAVWVRADSDLGGSADLELAVRMPGGLYMGFVAANADGSFTLRHPILRFAGRHALEVVARLRDAPHRWTSAAPMSVLVDQVPPGLSLSHLGATVEATVWDDETPVERLLVAGERLNGAGERSAISAGPTRTFDLGPGEVLTLWSVDEAGLRSRARSADRLGEVVSPHGAGAVEGGCRAVDVGGWSLLACVLLLARRRRPLA